jgi:hypothetical protein
MQHRFKTTCLDASKLLDGCYKLSTFMNRLNKMSVAQEGNGYGWTADEFKGDGFEALIEVLINCMSADKRIGIRNYAPWTGKDMGIDGVGATNEVKSRPVTVQVKYRSDVTSELTTAKGINRNILEQMYNNKPKVFGFKDIKKFIDNNAVFWDTFRTEMGI